MFLVILQYFSSLQQFVFHKFGHLAVSEITLLKVTVFQ